MKRRRDDKNSNEKMKRDRRKKKDNENEKLLEWREKNKQIS